MTRYKPTAGDRRFDQARRDNPDIDVFNEAALLRSVSDTYLSVMVHDHVGERSAGFKAMVEFELQRRMAKRANSIALISVGVAAIALAISLFSAV